MKKLLSIVMAMLLSVSLFACGNAGGNNTDVTKQDDYNGGKEVEIKYWNAGMKSEYLEKMIAAFNKKQSDWYVRYTASASEEAIKATFGMEDADTVDLYIVGLMYDTTDMEPLDDLLASTADGDSKPLKEKFDASYLDTELASDGHYYTLTNGGGVISIVYNQKLFNKAGIEKAPRTTDELAVVCDKLLNANITPLTHFSGGGYWSYFVETWFSQYDGNDYYMNNFWKCTDKDGKSPSKNVFLEKDGRYRVLKAMEKVVTPDYVMTGSNSTDHISAQTAFLNSDIGMMVNGAWMSNEMETTGNTNDYAVMKTPVISSIREKLTTVKNDAELRNLIDAIDAVTDGQSDESEYKDGKNYVINGKKISAADWNYVKDARNTVAVCYNGNRSFIPKYSDAKDGAKEFLKFFYSDEGLKIYAETTRVSLPVALSSGDIDTTGWNQLEQGMYNLLAHSKYQVSRQMMSAHSIYINGGANGYTGLNYIVKFCTTNPSDRMTADEAWASIIDRVETRYDSWISNIK